MQQTIHVGSYLSVYYALIILSCNLIGHTNAFCNLIGHIKILMLSPGFELTQPDSSAGGEHWSGHETIQNGLSRSLLYICTFMSQTCHSRVFSSVTRLLALLESTAEAPHRQVAKQANCPFLLIMVSLARLPRY